MNSRTYTKMFSTIITSSVWDEDSDTKVVWVTMLALQDQYHEVHASVPGLARMAKVSRVACEKALACFLAPDKDSRTKSEEGRRITEIEGGWKLINGQKYRDLMSADERREYKRVHEAKRREKLKKCGLNVDKCGQSMDSGGQKAADTDTDTDTEVQKNTEGELPLSGETKRFTKPTIEEVGTYGELIKLSAEHCAAFFDYYESNGWKVGRNSMRKWTSALANWKRRVDSSGGSGTASRATLIRELEIVEKDINRLTPEGMNLMTDKEADQFRRLVKRKKAIRVSLGMEAA